MQDFVANFNGALSDHRDVLIYGHLIFLAAIIALLFAIRGVLWWLERRPR